MPKLDEDASDVSGVGAILATEIKSGMLQVKYTFCTRTMLVSCRFMNQLVSLTWNYIKLIFPSPQCETKLHAFFNS